MGNQQGLIKLNEGYQYLIECIKITETCVRPVARPGPSLFPSRRREKDVRRIHENVEQRKGSGGNEREYNKQKRRDSRS